MTMLSPSPKFAVQDANGLPAVGWTLTTYAAGTSTPKATYTDITLGSANANPITLNARGEADVFLNGAYKFVLKDAVGATVWTVDEIRDVFTGQTFTNSILAGTLTVSSTAVTWSGNPTHSGNHTFSGNLIVNNNTTIGNASSDTFTIAPNAITWSNNPTHSGNHIWSGTQTYSAAVTANAALTAATSLALGFSLATGITGASSEKINATIYSPTFSAGVNVSAHTEFDMPYMRIGNYVVVGLRIQLSLTAGTTGTLFELSLPVASNFTAAENATGIFAVGGVAATVTASIANDTLAVAFTSNAAGTSGVSTGVAIYRVQ